MNDREDAVRDAGRAYRLAADAADEARQAAERALENLLVAYARWADDGREA